MSKRWFLILIILLALIIVSLIFLFWPQYPFADLECGDIDQILICPDFCASFYTVPDDAISELVAVLKNVTIYPYRKHKFWKELTGLQYPMMILQTTDGSLIHIAACNPVFIINDIGYYTEYEACQAIRDTYFRIAKSLDVSW